MWEFTVEIDCLIIANDDILEFVIYNFDKSEWEFNQLPIEPEVLVVQSLRFNNIELVRTGDNYTLSCGDIDNIDISWKLPQDFGKKLWDFLEIKIKKEE